MPRPVDTKDLRVEVFREVHGSVRIVVLEVEHRASGERTLPVGRGLATLHLLPGEAERVAAALASTARGLEGER